MSSLSFKFNFKSRVGVVVPIVEFFFYTAIQTYIPPNTPFIKHSNLHPSRLKNGLFLFLVDNVSPRRQQESGQGRFVLIGKICGGIALSSPYLATSELFLIVDTFSHELLILSFSSHVADTLSSSRIVDTFSPLRIAYASFFFLRELPIPLASLRIA